MKKLLSMMLSVGLLVAFTDLSAAQQKAEERLHPIRPDAAVMGQKDLCVSHKGDMKKYEACQGAARLSKGHVGGGPTQTVTVCSDGYWWTVSWGGITQGGPCSPEGAIK